MDTEFNADGATQGTQGPTRILRNGVRDIFLFAFLGPVGIKKSDKLRFFVVH